jgi:hypothetical protein
VNQPRHHERDWPRQCDRQSRRQPAHPSDTFIRHDASSCRSSIRQ